MKKRKQVKGAKKGTTEKTGAILRISMYKCKSCYRLFRKAEVLKDGNPRD